MGLVGSDFISLLMEHGNPGQPDLAGNPGQPDLPYFSGKAGRAGGAFSNTATT